VKSPKRFLNVLFPSIYMVLSDTWRLRIRPQTYRYSMRRRGVLVYIGANHGETLIDIAHKFQRVIALECNPVLFQVLKKRFSRFSNVEIYPFAASDSFQQISLFLPSNGNFFGAATAMDFSESNTVKNHGQFSVPSVDLGVFLELIGVSAIDLYISDIEGFDYVALLSLRRFIEEGRVARIQVEVWSDDIPSPFRLSKYPIHERDFDELLKGQYIKVAEGLSNQSNTDWVLNANWNAKDVLWILKK
jgi:FkbM family methyltransferase